MVPEDCVLTLCKDQQILQSFGSSKLPVYNVIKKQVETAIQMF